MWRTILFLLCALLGAGSLKPLHLHELPAPQFEEYLRIGHGEAYKIAFSPDGQTLAVAETDGVTLYDKTNLQAVAYFPHWHPVVSMAWSADGKSLVTGSQDGVRNWDVEQVKETDHFTNGEEAVQQVGWTSDGKNVIASWLNGELTTWDISSGTELERKVLRGTGDYDTNLEWSPDWSHYITLIEPKTFAIWTQDSTLPVAEVVLDWYIIGARWSPNGRYLAVFSSVNVIGVWDSQTWQQAMSFSFEGRGIVRDLAWSPDGMYLAAATGDGTVHIWQMDNPDAVATWNVYGVGSWYDFDHIAWSPDGKHMARVIDQALMIWDRDSSEEISMVPLTGIAAGGDLAWSSDGHYLAFETITNGVEIWDVETGQSVTHLEGLENVQSIAWSPDGKYLAIGAETGLSIWDTVTWQEITIPRTRNGSVSTAWSPDGQLLASASWDESVTLWDVPNWRPHRHVASGCCIHGVAWSRDGKFLGIAGENVQVMDISTWEEVDSLVPSDFPPSDDDTYSASYDLAWSPDGKSLYFTGVSSVYYWTLGNRVSLVEQNADFDGRYAVNDIQWSPDGEFIAVAGGFPINGYGTVSIWDAPGGAEHERTRLYGGLYEQVWSATWSPDGRRLATSWSDGIVIIWERVN